MYPVVFTQRSRPAAGKFCQFLTICSRASFSEFMQLSKFCCVSAPNIAMRAFSDVRQVVAISAVGGPLDAALATPGIVRFKQSRLVAKSFRLIVHASIGPPSVTPDFDFIAR